MRVGGGRDQEVHRSRSRVTSRVDDGCGHLTVARCHGFIQGQRVEGALKHQQASQSLGPGGSVLRDVCSTSATPMLGRAGRTNRTHHAVPRQ